MQRRLSWIQLTDLHFGNSEASLSKQRQLLDSICKDVVARQESTGISPELLFVTGDLVSPAEITGSDSDAIDKSAKKLFKDVTTQIQYFIEELNDKGISIRRVYCCPGNHDVVRPNVTPELDSILDRLVHAKGTTAQAKLYYEHILPIFREQGRAYHIGSWMSHLASFQEAIADAGFVGEIRRPDLSHASIYTRGDPNGDGQSESYKIICLNTAWACTKVTASMPSVPTCAQVQLDSLLVQPELRETDAVATIVLAHHPVGWMWPQERMEVREQLQRHADFFLRGHEHIEWINPSQSSVVEIAVGATSRGGIGLPQHYSLVEHDPFTGKARIYILEKNAHGGFDAKGRENFTAKDGAWVATITGPESRNQIVHSRVATRQLGALISSNLRSHGEYVGPVFSIDIARFSALSDEHKLLASQHMWRVVSHVLDIEDIKYDRVIISPAMDGMQAAFINNDKNGTDPIGSGCVDTLVHLDTIAKLLARRAPEYDYRYGIAYGSFSMHATMNKSYCVASGLACSAARRLAISVDAGTVGICSSVIAQCEREQGSLPETIKSRLLTRYEDNTKILWLPLTVRTTNPMAYAVMGVKAERLIKGRLVANSEHKLRMLAGYLGSTGVWDPKEDQDITIVVRSVWSGVAGGTQTTPVCAYTVEDNKLCICAGDTVSTQVLSALYADSGLCDKVCVTGTVQYSKSENAQGNGEELRELVSMPIIEDGSKELIACVSVMGRVRTATEHARCLARCQRFVDRVLDREGVVSLIVKIVVSHERAIL